MQRRRDPRLILALASYFSTSVFGVSAVVCMGTDGHFTVEAGTRSCCQEGGPGGGPAFAERAGENGPRGCSDCIDIALAAEACLQKSEAPGGKALEAALPAVLLPRVATLASRALRRAGPSPPLERRGALAHLRSVILLL